MSCTEENSINDCSADPDFSKKITFLFDNDTLTTDINVYGNKQFQYGDGFRVNRDKNEDIFKILKNNMPLKEKIDGDAFSYVLYTTELIENHDFLSINNIFGISVYYIKNDKFYHAFFTRDISNSFEIINELHCETTGLITNFIERIATKLTPDLSKKSVSAYHFAHFTNRNYYLQVEKNSKEMLDNRIKLYFEKLKKKNLISLLDIVRDDPPETCGKGCDYYIENSFCKLYIWGDEGYCSSIIGETCEEPMMIDTLTYYNSMTTDSIYYAFDDDLHYDFWRLFA